MTVRAEILIDGAAASADPATRASELGRALTDWESTGNRLYVSFFHALHAEAELDAALACIAGL